jgi:hypothetical protein
VSDPHKIYVPVRARGCTVYDNGGDPVCVAVNPTIAQTIATVINFDAAHPFSSAPIRLTP